MGPNGKRCCTRCVLPERPPHIVLDGESVCNVCRSHEAQFAGRKPSLPLETELVRIIQAHTRKKAGKYDCIVMCSGGKDSTASLYYMKKRYKLNPLAYTFDHGFEPDEALANVQRATRLLEVDHVVFKSTYMHRMFADAIQSGAPISLCHLCSLWNMNLTFDVAARFEIPLIVAGWTKGQLGNAGASSCVGAADVEHIETSAATVAFLKHYLPQHECYKGFALSVGELVSKCAKRFKSTVVSPLWFLPVREEEYVQIIRDELGWKPTELSYPRGSTNCRLNFLSSYYSIKYFGFTHYHIEMSKLIRQGAMVRAEALERLKPDFDTSLLESIAGELGVGFRP